MMLKFILLCLAAPYGLGSQVCEEILPSDVNDLLCANFGGNPVVRWDADGVSGVYDCMNCKNGKICEQLPCDTMGQDRAKIAECGPVELAMASCQDMEALCQERGFGDFVTMQMEGASFGTFSCTKCSRGTFTIAVTKEYDEIQGTSLILLYIVAIFVAIMSLSFSKALNRHTSNRDLRETGAADNCVRSHPLYDLLCFGHFSWKDRIIRALLQVCSLLVGFSLSVQFGTEFLAKEFGIQSICTKENGNITHSFSTEMIIIVSLLVVSAEAPVLFMVHGIAARKIRETISLVDDLIILAFYAALVFVLVMQAFKSYRVFQTELPEFDQIPSFIASVWGAEVLFSWIVVYPLIYIICHYSCHSQPVPDQAAATNAEQHQRTATIKAV